MIGPPVIRVRVQKSEKHDFAGVMSAIRVRYLGKNMGSDIQQEARQPAAQKLILIAAGGTGGHMFPASAFAAGLRARGFRIGLVTDARGARYAADFPADFVDQIDAATISSRDPAKAIGALIKIMRGVTTAKNRLLALDPVLVAGFGGYPSFPSLWAARDLKIPILIHEQNAVLGRVNRMFAGRAAGIASGFERLDRLPVHAMSRRIVTGNPVRPAILEARQSGFPALPPGGTIRVLVIGGSQGARIVGDMVPRAFALLDRELRRRLAVTQQVRENQLEEARSVYAEAGIQAECAPFFGDIGRRLGDCHFVIARAGASSLTEIAVVGRPSLLIPFALAADDHQTANAEGLLAAKAADLVTELDCTPAGLATILADRLSDPGQLLLRAEAARAVGRPDATEALVGLAMNLVK